MSESNTDMPFRLFNSHGQTAVAPPTSDMVRAIAEDMAKAGRNIEEINSELRGLGFRELDASPAAVAERQLAALKASADWCIKFNAGDPEAEAQFQALTTTIALGGNATREMRPEDYALAPTHHPVLAGATAEQRTVLDTEWREMAAGLNMSRDAASHLMQLGLDGAAAWAQRSDGAQIEFAEKQTAMLHRVLEISGDVEAQIAQAEATIKVRTGKPVDIRTVAKQRGAELAFEMISAAQRAALGY